MAAPYRAPAQTMVLVNGVWVDDAQKIQYSVQDIKTPVFGYNDRFYRSNMLGRTLVQGKLCINFRYPGALMRAIKDKATVAADTFRRFQFDRLAVQDLADLQNLASRDPAEIVRRVGQQFRFGPSALQDTADLASRAAGIRARTGQSVIRTPGDEERTRPVDKDFMRASDEIHNNVQFVLIYGDPDTLQDPESVEVIEGVQLDSMSKTISIDVPSGGQVILEEYTFYARDIRHVTDTRSVETSPEEQAAFMFLDDITGLNSPGGFGSFP